MKTIRRTYDTTGAQEWIPLNTYKCPFEVSVDTEGGASGDIEFTLDDILDSGITPAVSGTVANGILKTPVAAIRINVTTAPLTFKVLQSG